MTELHIDDQTYHLGYNFNSIADAEDVCRCNLLAALGNVGDCTITAAELRGLLYAMIVPWEGFPQKPDEGLKAVGDLIRPDAMGAVLFAVGEALAAAVSEEYLAQYRERMPPPNAPPEVTPETQPPAES